jgi:hypothetical protein
MQPLHQHKKDPVMKLIRHPFHVCLVVLACTSMLLSGCSGKGKKKDVTGSVTYKGKPLPRGKINFFGGKDGKQQGSGEIRDGEYKVTQAPTGDVKITIVTSHLTKNNPELAQYEAQLKTYKETLEGLKRAPAGKNIEDEKQKLIDNIKETEKLFNERKKDAEVAVQVPETWADPDKTPIKKTNSGGTLDIDLDEYK